MAADFFEQQDLARKKSGRLIFLLIAAVVGIVLVTYPVVAGAFYLLANSGDDPQAGDASIPFWNIELFLLVSVGTLLLVSFSSLYKIAALKGGGGGSVARSLGGTPVNPDTRDPDERKLLNVVEEMAIASGVPVPPVYLLDHEKGINAFAAGYKPDDAVIGVTRGAVEQLSRDELQGVIAHEFSHILNGDMRLNIRLMGLIFGILVLGILGRIALRVAFYSGSGRKKDGKAMLAIGLTGLLLIILGFVGVFFGKLIKAAVSRQREFLADASAVQFTRNPDGIGGALKRLAGFSHGSRVENPHAEEAAHMFFGSAVSSWMGGAMATHPPMTERIKRIDPSWDGTLPEPRKSSVQQRGSIAGKPKPGAPDLIPGGAGLPGMPGGMLGTVVTGAVIADGAGQAGGAAQAGQGTAMDSVGQLDDAHIDYARQLIARIPGALREAARHPNGAQAVVFLVLLDADAGVRDKQLARLDADAEPAVAALVRTLLPHASEVPHEARLSLMDLGLPALQKMSREQYAGFRKQVDALIEADGRVDLFEWTLRRLLTRHLEAHLFRPRDPKVHYYALKPVAEHCAVLMSTLARVGSREPGEVERAFASGASALGLAGLTLQGTDACRLSAVDRGFDELAKLSPREKKKLLHGCATVIAADGEITVSEGELMRAISDSLDCPMPPLLPGQMLVQRDPPAYRCSLGRRRERLNKKLVLAQSAETGGRDSRIMRVDLPYSPCFGALAMRQARIAISLLAVFAVAGCQEDPEPVTQVPGPAPYDSGYTPLDPVAIDPAGAQAPSAYDPATGPGGAAAGVPSVAPAARTYMVKEGDTLWAIATRVYGDGQRWVDIAQANPSLDPAKMPVGREIVLP